MDRPTSQTPPWGASTAPVMSPRQSQKQSGGGTWGRRPRPHGIQGLVALRRPSRAGLKRFSRSPTGSGRTERTCESEDRNPVPAGLPPLPPPAAPCQGRHSGTGPGEDRHSRTLGPCHSQGRGHLCVHGHHSLPTHIFSLLVIRLLFQGDRFDHM